MENSYSHGSKTFPSLEIEGRIRTFVESYVSKLRALSSNVSKEDKELMSFPLQVIEPHKVTCHISKTHGMAIDFVEQTTTWSFDFIHTEKPIENALLYYREDEYPFFSNEAENVILWGIDWVTHSYFALYKEVFDAMSRGVKVVNQTNALYVETKSGDTRLVDVGLGWLDEGKSHSRRVKYLWLFADNTGDSLTIRMAEERATQDYENALSHAWGGQSPSNLAAMLNEYERLLNEPAHKEEVMQRFLAANLVILEPSYRRVYKG